MSPTPEGLPSSLWEFLAKGDAGNSARIIAEFQRLVDDYKARVPAGIIPNLSEEMLDKFLADAIATYPGFIDDGIAQVKADIFALVSTGKGPVSHDSSALA